MELLGGFTFLAFGIKKGRFAFPLPTGMGKTQSIVAWCSALHRLGYKDVSVAVAAGKVEALAQLKRDLIANGVPAESIGLIHSFKHDAAITGELPPGYASEPSTADNDDRPIMLVTHNRIHRGNLAQFNEYKGKPRNLLIWDESLLVSNSRYISHRSMKKALGYRIPDIGETSEAAQYFRTALLTIEAELASQQKGNEPQAVNLPVLAPTALDIIKQQIGTGTVEEVLRDFLAMSQEPLRVVYTHQEGGLITYDITVPRELDSIAILDASYPIRALERMDKSIQLGGKFSSNMKRYDHVCIHHLKSPSGRESMTKDFSKSKREDRKVSAEVCDLISGIPEDEGVIVFTFKKPEGVIGMRKTVDFKDLLMADLKASGINTQAMLPEGNRIVMLTWGQETSLSMYSYCKHVVFAGVLHRSHLDLASAMAGQVDNILYDITPPSIKEVMNSEIAHSVYQALSRGSCRKIEGNQACKMGAWLIHSNDEIRPLLEQVMPGVKWVSWTGKHLKSTHTKARISDTISSYLKGLPQGVSKISTSSLKKAAGLDKVPPTTFTKALKDALSIGIEWKLEGRSAVRFSAADYFPS
jgi:hypothetical protein